MDQMMGMMDEPFRSLFDESIDGVLLASPDGQIFAANAAACRLFQRSEAELRRVGRPGVADLSDPRFSRALHERATTGRFRGELTLVRGDGTKFQAELSSKTFQTRDGAARINLVVRDITERKRAEEALRDTAERARLVYDNLPNSYVYQYTRREDGTTCFLYLSAGVERLHGVTLEDALRDASKIREQVAIDQLEALERAEAVSLQDSRDFEIEVKIRRGDGELRWLRLHSRPRFNSQGTPVWDGVATDVTKERKAAEALRESDQRFSSAFQHAAVGMALVNLEGRWLQVNPALCTHLGYSEAEMLELTFQDVTYPDDLETDLSYARQLLAGEIQTYQMEKRYFQKSGAVVWGLLSVSLVRDNEGKPQYFIGQIQDITSRKRAEMSLVESEAKFRVLANGTASAIFIHREAHFCYVNPAFQATTGYTEAELLNMDFWELAQQEFREEVRTRGLASRRSGAHTRFEFKMLTKSGEERWLDCSHGLIEFEGTSAVLGTAQDISERKNAEDALKKSDERFRQIAENIQEAFWMTDPAIRSMQYISPAYETIWGRTCSSLYENPRSFLEAVHPDDRERVTRVSTEKSGKPFEHEYRIIRTDGQVRWVLDRGFPVIDQAGQVSHYVGIASDITEQKEAAVALRRSREQLRDLLARLQRLREKERTIIAREVHDVLGQMLTGLKMDMSWWERRFNKIADSHLRSALEQKVADTSHLVDIMIEAVQKISRDLRPSVLDNIGLGAALQFEARQFQERTGTVCDVRVPVALFPIPAEIATGVFRVFQELMTNVARHAGATRVTVVLRETKGELQLEVSDDGRGIRDEELRDSKSLGLLGMSERARLMGGTLWIAGSIGFGTNIRLTIPVR